jgi:hypothetical protein
MAEATACHPNKPRTVYCRRRHLMQWTGWSDWEIDEYVRSGLLRVRDCPRKCRRLFFVASAQKIIDSGQ